MLPKSTSGVTDIFPIRWDDPQKLGWGILVEFADGNYRTLFVGGKEQATEAAMKVQLKFVGQQNRSTA